jgi:hypothetical protein
VQRVGSPTRTAEDTREEETMPQQDRDQPRDDEIARESREGFTGGESLTRRRDFTGRPNVTEEREDAALRPHDDETQAHDPSR